MSPEQIAGRPDDLDTRSDVYALGVLAYRILGGRLPLDLADLSIPEAARTIETEEPMPLGSVCRECRGDLQAVVAKALSKSRDRRYQSASDLAGDLRRVLRHEAVDARMPTAAYRLRMFGRRHRVALSGAAFMITALLAGITMLAIAYRATSDVEERTRSSYLEQAAQSEALRNMLMAFVDDRGDRAGAAERLERIAVSMPQWGGADGFADVALRSALGSLLMELDFGAKAVPHLRAALDMRMRLSGPRDRATVQAAIDLAEAQLRLGRLEQARQTIDPAARTALEAFGAEDPVTRAAMQTQRRAAGE